MAGLVEPTPLRCIYVARHGLKVPNEIGKDNLSLPLTAEGEEALQELVAYLEAHDIRFGRVLCSPWLRCRQTVAAMAPLLGRMGTEVQLEPGLAEVLGDNHGLRQGSTQQETGPSGTALEVLQSRLREVLAEHAAASASCSKGSGADGGSSGGEPPLIAIDELQRDEDEQFMSCMHRSLALVERLTPEHFKKGPILLMTHGGTTFGIMQALLAGKAEPFDKARLPDMGSITCLREESAGGPWRVVGSATPARGQSGRWEVRWSRGSAAGGDARQL